MFAPFLPIPLRRSWPSPREYLLNELTSVVDVAARFLGADSGRVLIADDALVSM
jgi:hypothetical protein